MADIIHLANMIIHDHQQCPGCTDQATRIANLENDLKHAQAHIGEQATQLRRLTATPELRRRVHNLECGCNAASNLHRVDCPRKPNRLIRDEERR